MRALMNRQLLSSSASPSGSCRLAISKRCGMNPYSDNQSAGTDLLIHIRGMPGRQRISRWRTPKLVL
jgi:hypothetical protein